jgi:plasmid stabilization system protein ParE
VTWPPFHPEAREEFNSTVEDLREIAKPLARRFVRRTSEVIAILRMFPGSGSPLGLRARRFSLHPFKYDLVYVPVEGDIFLIAFAHHKRRPGYWRKRLR